MRSIGLDRNNLIFVAQGSSNSYVTVSEFKRKVAHKSVERKSRKPNIISGVCVNEHQVVTFWSLDRERGEEVPKMLKVERQDLSWQPYCQHSIIQSNPHLNRKQCARRKTGKTKQQQGVREEEICKNSPPRLDWLQKQWQQQQMHSTITQLKWHRKEKGRFNPSKCRGLLWLSVALVLTHKMVQTQTHRLDHFLKARNKMSALKRLSYYNWKMLRKSLLSSCDTETLLWNPR